jgi:hypothetical protein
MVEVEPNAHPEIEFEAYNTLLAVTKELLHLL